MKKKNHIKMRFSTLLLCCLAIVLYAAPCGAEIVDNVASGDILNVGTGMDVDRIDENNWLYVFGTLNLYPGAYVDCGIYAFDGSTVNIYAGELVADSFIMLMGSTSTAVVTVYGTGFAVDWDLNGTADPLDPSETKFTPSDNGSVLEGTYKNGYPINLLFLSDVPIYLMETAVSEVEIDIDIKPGGNPNNINLKSKGVVPVAVLTTDGTDGFDAVDVDPDTVEFAGTKPIRWKICDVDDDGDNDMLFHFDTQELFENDLNEDSTVATLTGETFGGDTITGTDTVCIKPQKKK
jgi:hypothetical protein